MKKFILLMFLFAFATTVANAQLKDLTKGGRTLAKSTTYTYYETITSQGMPFSFQVFSNLSVNDTTEIAIYQTLSNSVGGGAWVQTDSTRLLVPSDTNIVITDTTWGKFLKLTITGKDKDSTGKVHAWIWLNTLK